MQKELNTKNELLKKIKNITLTNDKKDDDKVDDSIKKGRTYTTVNPPLKDDPRRADYNNFYKTREDLIDFFVRNNEHKFKTFETRSGIRLIFVPKSFSTKALVETCKPFIESVDPFKKYVEDAVTNGKGNLKAKTKSAIKPVWINGDGSLNDNLNNRPEIYCDAFKITELMTPNFFQTTIGELAEKIKVQLDKTKSTYLLYVKDYQHKKAAVAKAKIEPLEKIHENLIFIRDHLYEGSTIDPQLQIFATTKPYLKTVKISALKKNLFKQLTHSGVAFIPYDPEKAQFVTIIDQKFFDDLHGRVFTLGKDFKVKINIDKQQYDNLLNYLKVHRLDSPFPI